MNRFSCSTRSLLSFMASATPRWWPSALAQRVSPLMLRFRRASRFTLEPRDIATINTVEGDEPGKRGSRLSVSSANLTAKSQNNELLTVAQGMKNIIRGTALGVIAGDKRIDDGGSRVASQLIYDKLDTLGHPTHNQRGEIVSIIDNEVSDDEEYSSDFILPKSGHRDGSIYRNLDMWWKRDFRIADRNETRVEPMTLSNPPNCIIHNGTCRLHYARRMLQILSLELDEIAVDGGLAELYGYIAVRDKVDLLLNYVVNFRRDDPITVEQGSLIKMTGPKRGIDMMDLTLIEYDMRIKSGKDEKHDLQLIDGASLIGPLGEWDEALTCHIPGRYGTVGITLARFNCAVEATVEVLILDVQSGFNLLLSCLTSQLNKEILLFHGSIAESRGLKSSVVAVPWDSTMDLKFKVSTLSSISNQYYCCFMAKVHGHDTQEIKTAFASISVKVTWSIVPIAPGHLH